jgi:carboxyl-terminal processing protease
VQRNAESLDFTVERREIKVAVATGELLDGNIGLVRIANFNKNCAKETIAIIKDLQEQGADKLIFDVRNNPGGYVSEMIDVLDYLLPEGVLYRSQDYMGREEVEQSDASCLEMPMAVLVNGNSYSAAEFFAACLQEFKWATVVGERTTGKGHYQNTIRLSDGSAVNLSTGKYFTPSGVNLTEMGGLTPDVLAQVDKETAANIYAQLVPAEEDPQIQAAVQSVIKIQ